MKVREFIDQYIREVQPMRPFLSTHLYALRRVQREIGDKDVEKLKPADTIAYCRGRRESASPATIAIEVSYWRGALAYASEGMGLSNVSKAPVDGAMAVLRKYGLIGSSRPRSFRPEREDLDRLIAYFKDRKPYMAEIVEFQVASTRRISETCRLLFSDVNRATRTCVVRDMKDPKRKAGNDHEFPLLGRAWEIIAERMQSWNGHPGARIFPYNAHSVSGAFTHAKSALGLHELHLHDLRREGASRLLEDGYSVPQVQVVTGHKCPTMLLRVYTKIPATDLHNGPAGMRRPAADNRNGHTAQPPGGAAVAPH